MVYGVLGEWQKSYGITSGNPGLGVVHHVSCAMHMCIHVVAIALSYPRMPFAFVPVYESPNFDVTGRQISVIQWFHQFEIPMIRAKTCLIG